ncbi:MAG: PASTA domain-containing protein [Bacteroidales bacterium OttesenSCG-928-I14]|jgi:beta-lactam-binding protein with PASTA domain|nr:PASTA domain-containing protein [Bacteroidales bacterium OttesenSCG-928-I14]
MSIFSKYYVKCGLILLFSFSIIISVAKYLEIYTQHGQYVKIPNIIGFQVKTVENILKKKKLHYSIIDSVFIPENTPGSILETIPPAGTKVKPNRTIYLTINSINQPLLSIPEIKYMPHQEAQLLLQSIGFKNVQIRTECGPHKNLVVGLETKNGNKLNTGDRITASTTLIILVSSGDNEKPFSMDSDSISDIDSRSEEFLF